MICGLRCQYSFGEPETLPSLRLFRAYRVVLTTHTSDLPPSWLAKIWYFNPLKNTTVSFNIRLLTRHTQNELPLANFPLSRPDANLRW